MGGMRMRAMILIVAAAALLAGLAPRPAAGQSLWGNGSGEKLPGVELAAGLSEITGVAISPMLGVSAVGAWRYYRAPEQARPRLPWYCQPWAWGTGFCVLAICFLKDLFGTVTPPLLKKPLDVLELFEDKASAVLASAAFVPLVATRLDQFTPAGEGGVAASAGHGALALAAAAVPGAGWLAALLLVPAAIVVFLTVWLACHTINVLILLSPFGLLDAVLKLFKVGLLVSVAALALIHPYLGALISVALFVVAAFIAPWAFRLSLFGTLCAGDILFPEWAACRAVPERAHAFLARRTAGVPARTYGRLRSTPDGRAEFVYRPWIVFPERTVPLTAGSLAVCRGMFFPSLLMGEEAGRNAGGGEALRRVLIFLPRYRTLEERIASQFQVPVEVCDGGVRKGFQAVRAWFRDVLRGGTEPVRSVTTG